IIYWFGRLFVEYLGSDKIIAVYVLGFLAGAVVFLLAYNLIPYYKLNIPGGGMVGASAAVNAVVVACATLVPNYTFNLLFLGPVKLFAVYVLGFLAGTVALLLAYNLIPYYKLSIPGGGMVGASAAVNAAVVACATLVPNSTFYLLFLGPVRIKYLAAFFVVLSFIGSVGSNAGGNLAHLGGAFIGYMYIRQLQAGHNLGGWVTVVLDWFRKMLKPEA